jgi:type I restriction enzyme S subunit
MKIEYYQAYKDNGVEWIGKVPEHWKVTAITNITTTVSIKNHPNEELLSVYRDYGVIIKSTRDDNHNKAGQNLDSYKLVEPGYLVINKMKAWQGSLGISEFRGIVSPAYITCKTDKIIIERGYLHHLLRCRVYINEYNRLSYGVRVDQWDMRYDDFKYIPVLLPPIPEQKAIAHYLDTKTAQCDRKIDLLTQKATLYGKLKQSLINETVTRRLDKSVPMKDSGVEWLGEVPEHWEVVSIKRLARNQENVVQTGPFGAQLHASDYIDEGIPLILIRNVKNLWIDDFDIPKISGEKAKQLSMYCLEIGDIVFSRVGSIGRIALVTEREEGWMISGQMLRLRIKNSLLDKKYLIYAFSSEYISSAALQK